MKTTRQTLTTCSVDDCDGGAPIRRGMCNAHYKRLWRRGELTPRPSPAERLAAGLVRMPNGCLEWTRSRNKQGYGGIRFEGKVVKTHRLAWILANGPIPDGLDVLHHCDNPPCCDVEGCLFLGTVADNNADRDAKGRNYWRKRSHCASGHLFDADNTTMTPDGKRRCRACGKDRSQRYRAKRSVALVEAA